MGLIDIALTILNYSRLCHDYSIYSNINREVNKDINKKEVYNILIFQYFKVRHVSSAMTYHAHLFFKLIRNRLSKGLAKFEILKPYVSPRKLGNNLNLKSLKPKNSSKVKAP